MKPADLDRFLAPTLSHAGLELDEVDDATIYQNRPGWVIYYRGRGCKLQICWSARDGASISCSRHLMHRTNSVCRTNPRNGSLC